MKTGKASSLDSISNGIIKAASKHILTILVALFNKLIKLKHFPSPWAVGMIIPIHKSGDLDDPNNFRGITLNSCLSKLFTFILNERLTTYCDMLGLISYNQIGFRKDFRTSDHVFTLKTLIDKSFSENKKLYVCFVDFKKAYDTVWRNGLFFKLLNYGFSPGFVNVIKNMYAQLKACIQLPNGLSNTFQSLIGLKQGCNLSPILFNLFVNEFINTLNNIDTDAPSLRNLKASCLFYADDLVLISESEVGLQKSLDTLKQFTSNWFLDINPKKTKHMIFAKGKRNKEIKFSFGDTVLDQCDSYCYLGVVFSKSGSMNMASKALYDKAVGAMFSLIRSVNKHYACNFNLLLGLFDKLIVPISLYNSEVWGTNFLPVNQKSSDYFNIKKISKHIDEQLQIKFLKIILGVNQRVSNWAVLSETGRFPMIIRVFISMIKYYFHLMSTESDLLSAALSTNIILARNGHNSWYRTIERVFKFANLEYLLYTSDNYEVTFQLRKLDKSMKSLYLDKWSADKASLSQNTNKIGILLDIKDNFELSDYLVKSKVAKHRIAISKIRLSSHRFPIETGRYEQIPREDRTCPFGCGQLGDEAHYLFKCKHPFLLTIRDPLLLTINNTDNQFTSMIDSEKLRYMLKSTNENMLKLVGMLSYKIQKVFKDITS